MYIFFFVGQDLGIVSAVQAQHFLVINSSITLDVLGLDGDVVSDADSGIGDKSRFLTNHEEAGTPLALYTVINSFNSLQVASSSCNFSLIIGWKYYNTQRWIWTHSFTLHD